MKTNEIYGYTAHFCFSVYLDGKFYYADNKRDFDDILWALFSTQSKPYRSFCWL